MARATLRKFFVNVYKITQKITNELFTVKNAQTREALLVAPAPPVSEFVVNVNICYTVKIPFVNQMFTFCLQSQSVVDRNLLKIAPILNLEPMWLLELAERKSASVAMTFVK